MPPDFVSRSESPETLQSPSSVNSLAAHLGIPESLPRPPRTVAKSNEMLTDFESLRRSYLSMIANQSSEDISSSPPNSDMSTIRKRAEMAAPHVKAQAAALQAAALASPEISNDFLCSLFISSSPYNVFNVSPDDPALSLDLSTQIIDAIGDEFDRSDRNQPLFGVSEMNGGTFTLSSAVAMLDAPTQSRRYLNPSTSPKEVPTSFTKNSKKRSSTVAFGDKDEEDGDDAPAEALGPNATELETIEYKRRLNTIAARRSRRRKLQHALTLESRIEELEKEVEKWKTKCKVLQESQVDELEKEAEKWKSRCEILQEVLRSKSVDFRFDDDV
ncbi:hypothetical protein GYMLUDRAFT_41195 [Collybiopsis luxurians FD-317 M1]|uniref:BZIP domain-containing protein n=1 Tax=Collybiopsis luxurians FD-317 M1 TaxID=944289 RepID=A0A0D0BGA9_9AGAR|nr:hypothetical protein GYMLUDRAFT_41195 [Collybiopsis luxurians FD-317 M1]